MPDLEMKERLDLEAENARENTRWIWADRDREPDRYAEFRREFFLDEVPETAELRIGADTVGAAWLNGKFVHAGQFSDYPEEKTYTGVPVAGVLRPGKNVLAVLAHYCGVPTASYIPGAPRLWFELAADGRIVCRSGEATWSRLSPAYAQGKQVKISRQLGFAFTYDASGDDGWREAEYDHAGNGWRRAFPADEKNTPPVPRPLPPSVLHSPTPFRIAAQGGLLRRGGEGMTVAQLMQSDCLSARHAKEFFMHDSCTVLSEAHADADGFYIVIDMGREECGYIRLEVSEAAPGTVIDVAVGEHLADLRVRAATRTANFASRCVCRGGGEEFTHLLNRYAGRYMELHVTRADGRFALRYAGLIPVEYPLDMRGKFVSPDTLSNQIFEVSRRTLHLCIHEHYEDTPWREQALYANDARNQALAGYYAFGEYEAPRVSLDLLERGFGADGFLELCAPAMHDFTIPAFTFAWYLAVREHLLYSGDTASAKLRLPGMARMLGKILEKLDGDLLPTPTGKRYWHFYDWAEGLDGTDCHPLRGQSLEGRRFDAPLNLFLIIALRAAAEVFEWCEEAETCGFRQVADAVARTVKTRFWDAERGLFVTYVGEQAIPHHHAELTQALSLLAGVPDVAEAESLRRTLAGSDDRLVGTTLSQSVYKFDALLSGGETFAAGVFERIRADWGYMLSQGATSFWETLDGERAFGHCGSLCHGWSAVPAYILPRYLLGAEPLAPGFRKFRVAPLVTAADSASGTIPTPYGDIEIEWRKNGEKYSGTLTVPDGYDAEFALENPIEWALRRPCP